MADLSDSVTLLTGVGPKRIQALKELGIATIHDLLYHFPFRYEDLKVKDLNEISDQEKVTLKGIVVATPILTRFGPNRNRLVVRLLVQQQVVIVTFFNQPWLKDRFVPDQEIAIFGKWDQRRQSMTGMKIFTAQGDDHGMDAIYSVNKGIHQGVLIKLIKEAFDKYKTLIPESVPASIRAHYRLLNEQQIVGQMHFPKDNAEAKAARRSAIFREFFLFECKIQRLRGIERSVGNGVALHYQLPAVQEFISKLPFELTHGQKQAVNEIAKDMKSPHQMNRLLQGDVGSGKTVVAAIAMFSAITAGYQTALMVPTEILATQHFEKLSALFATMDVKTALLTGSTPTKARTQILEALRTGKINVLIGTHALIQDTVNFKNLGFVVIDEQHRFGVDQRKKLREKGIAPDVLMMTATPIPRTLAITTYGEMDVSSIREMPQGRLPVKTSWVKNKQSEQVQTFLAGQLAHKNQAFVISPLIEESETMDLKNAQALYETYVTAFEPKYKVALLHGQMNNADKNAIMTAFSQDEIQILVSTTVVEVGVDVPNATVMIIYDADRFGLSQLHQLRGRVGRGVKQAYCILIADPKNDIAVQRMTAMVATNDGFELSEKDLELRGPGDVFGAKQSGLPDFKVGDPVADFNVLQAAQIEAQQIFSTDPDLDLPDHQGLKTYLRHFGAIEQLD
ncbi:ATP-dependent DNA helicase RecG [Agrilactobacillus composti DSM 18527 = JCM 14202]|uniref:ATP-dependent DNA helicase RecG n=1 Tax=Agrilactobacillus composti DSM 18527 = JCM 14202 TaxID=1423734 RepID=A0A0R1Y3D7_9LACO|nr:ATP-dependent DNA helicase RecG [Agrilactobacillus composti]KRM36816.1 ATP-dependent DNA helicase RecG [Agrilactobacillus composti DSM 18527 = JCM 14202]